MRLMLEKFKQIRQPFKYKFILLTPIKTVNIK